MTKTHLCLVTFDLNNGATQQDYQNAYQDLKAIGLIATATGENGTVVKLPNTTCMGSFTGSSSASVSAELATRIDTAFRRRGFNAEVLVNAGVDAAWNYRATQPPLPLQRPR